jgi:hypothetical protein
MRLVMQFILNGLGARSERVSWDLAKRAAIALVQPQLRSTNMSRAHPDWGQWFPSQFSCSLRDDFLEQSSCLVDCCSCETIGGSLNSWLHLASSEAELLVN